MFVERAGGVILGMGGQRADADDIGGLRSIGLLAGQREADQKAIEGGLSS